MKLDHVQIKQFRNLTDVSLHPSTSLNVIYGANGSGKSSLVEAIHYLGFGRSFRTHRHDHAIQHGEEAFVVFCQITSDQPDDESVIKLGYQRDRKGNVQIRRNGETLQRVSELVRHLPVQLFTPQSADIVSGGPGGRRRFLDWALFHVEQSFHSVSACYQKTLKHRNALLKQNSSELKADGSDYWTQQMVRYGEQLNDLREALVSALQPYINDNLKQFLTDFCFEISYHRGWEKGRSLAAVLQQNFERDQRLGFTHSGPHKADLRIKTEGVLAAERLSRGQARMLVAALLLSESEYLHRVQGRQSLFLLDDIGAELDAAMREKFLTKLLASSAQVFVTAIEQQQVAFMDDYKDKKVFHVEHGQVKEELK
ncbi:DNA replication and repair protein RecF [Saliniradius amylolyticus]|uniref:DNA replication and repair protein RecF n=1 Tax=Saliniradius amylolyticus TaxID=2183582 RepID=A0A2S2E0I2_9ALTE|nr:DNA replication/repair protein RecF [Saliniradius amylolyticus]AWL10517.1 DNA replication and repair protein RecF [Saliniradius amylolyticus]